MISSIPIVINQQSLAQQIRRSVDFCYLCGEKLPLRTEKEWKTQIDAEHVIKRSVLGTSTPGVWPVILDVHVNCHKIKNEDDDPFGLFHKVKTESPTDWPIQLKSFPLKPMRLQDPHSGQREYAFGGVDSVYAAIWTSVRGLHSILYKSFLPSVALHQVFAPCGEAEYTPLLTPDCTAHFSRKRDEIESVKEYYLTVIGAAVSENSCDRITAWDGQLEYAAVWGEQGEDDLFTCYWCLKYPEVFAYADSTDWHAHPWVGAYKASTRPSLCQVINWDEVRQYQEALLKNRGDSFIRIR